MIRNKITVLAGTHQRENEFSHPVADMLVAYYGKQSKPAVNYITGIDGARMAHIYDFAPFVNIAVAKVYGIGKQSPSYIKQQMHSSLFLNAVFKVRNATSGTEPAEHFAHTPHRTSVHSEIIQQTRPDLIFDLHSYHRLTSGIDGTAATLGMNGTQEANELISACLARAKHTEPTIYGSSTSPCPEMNKRGKLEKLREQVYNRRMQDFSRGHLIKVLSGNKPAMRQFTEELHKLDREVELEFYKAWGNNWYLFNNVSFRSPNYCCFEGVHWGPQSRQATSRFITNYLQPGLNNVTNQTKL